MAPNSEYLQHPDQTLYLVDVSSFIFRAYFAIRNNLKNSKGEPTNAVYGVTQMLSRLNDDARPQYLAVTFDSKEPSFRKLRYAQYKANRESPPDDLIPQFARIEQLVSAFGMHAFRQSGVEADDLIGTLTRKWLNESTSHRVVIVSSDKDLMQLIEPQSSRVVIWDTMNNKFYGAPQVIEKFGVGPEQIRDYLALVGDSSDNIPGVPSIGPKTAAELLKEWGTLDAVLEAARNGKIAGKRAAVLVSHAEDARLSQELATIHCEIPVQFGKRDFAYTLNVKPAMIQLAQELEFFSLIKKWEGASSVVLPSVDQGASKGEPPQAAFAQVFGAQAPKVSIDGVQFTAVQTEDQLAALIKKLESHAEFGFDLETTSLNPREAEIVGIALAVDATEGFYIPVGHQGLGVVQLDRDFVLARLKPLLEDPKHKKIGQNLKYDWSVLYSKGLRPQGIGADTMVASYLLEPEGRHNLDTLAQKYLGYQVLTYEEVCGKGKDAISFADVPVDVATRYSGEDAWIALKLWRELQRSLEAEKLLPIFSQIDMPMVDVLCRMELEGVSIDAQWLAGLSREFGASLETIRERVSAYAQGEINLNSPKQLAQLLFEQLKLPPQTKTKTGYSTDASVLEALAPLHDVPRLLLEFREIAKLKGTYVDPLPGLKDSRTGKIHANFHQTVAATGRLSSSDPNLQNIPIRTERGKLIRRAFVPSPGRVLLAADYSQIELRLLAHMSGDRELVGAFSRDEDVHQRTAADIFGIRPDQVDQRQRGVAKAINFGLMYGKTAFGLAAELHISRKEAQETIDRYFARYSGVKKYLDQSIAFAREHGFAMTLSGRKRKLPDINNRNMAVRNNAERMAMNTPIQGTAADLMKIAMIQVDQQMIDQGLASRLIIQVHDELVLDVVPAELERVTRLVVETMENAMKLDVPLRVNAAHGQNWSEL